MQEGEQYGNGGGSKVELISNMLLVSLLYHLVDASEHLPRESHY